MSAYSTRKIRLLGRRADTILRNAREVAHAINASFGYNSEISDLADDVVCTAENLASCLEAMPARLRAGGQP